MKFVKYAMAEIIQNLCIFHVQLMNKTKEVNENSFSLQQAECRICSELVNAHSQYYIVKLTTCSSAAVIF